MAAPSVDSILVLVLHNQDTAARTLRGTNTARYEHCAARTLRGTNIARREHCAARALCSANTARRGLTRGHFAARTPDNDGQHQVELVRCNNHGCIVGMVHGGGKHAPMTVGVAAGRWAIFVRTQARIPSGTPARFPFLQSLGGRAPASKTQGCRFNPGRSPGRARVGKTLVRTTSKTNYLIKKNHPINKPADKRAGVVQSETKTQLDQQWPAPKTPRFRRF